MITVRKNTFETNSSSTHAIVVPKEVNEEKYNLWSDDYKEYQFGRDLLKIIDYWDDKFAYAYIILNTAKNCGVITDDDFESFIENVKSAHQEICNIIGNVGSFESFESVLNYVVKDVKAYDAYVDHAYDLVHSNFTNRMINDYEFVKRFIFNRESYITIGGDEYRGYYIKMIGFEYDYHYEWDLNLENYVGEFWSKLKEYEKTHDVYLKGN